MQQHRHSEARALPASPESRNTYQRNKLTAFSDREVMFFLV